MKATINFQFLITHPAHFIALGCGSGLSPKAPGTTGTLFAWLVFLLVDYSLNLQTLLTTASGLSSIIVFMLLATALSTWATKITAHNCSIADPGAIVCDEIVAFWVILLFAVLGSFWLQILAFILFRFFDAVKFGLVAWADKNFKGFGWRGAWGVMLDDFIAAAMTLLLIVPILWFN